jgi:hypothetical protein
MFAFTLYIPTRLSELLTLISKKSKYDRAFGSLPNHAHVIVCGHIDIAALREFLREFFCLDHGASTMKTQVVLLAYDEPDEELVMMLDDPAYHKRVKYVKGSAIDFGDLRRVKADEAEACFVMGDKFSLQDPSQGLSLLTLFRMVFPNSMQFSPEDAESVMRSLVISHIVFFSIEFVQV